MRRRSWSAVLARSILPPIPAAAASMRWEATKSSPLADSVARQSYRLVVIAIEEFRVGGNAVVNCRERIAGAHQQRSASGLVALLPAVAPAEHQAIYAQRQREIRIEAQRRLEFGQRILVTSDVHIGGRQRKMRPGILVVGTQRCLGHAMGYRHGDLAVLPTHLGIESMADGEDTERPAVIRVDGNRFIEQRLGDDIVPRGQPPEVR